MPVTSWHGKEIAAQITLAAIKAVDDTTQAAAAEGEKDHWWHARRAQQGLEGQTINEHARVVRGGQAVAGKFGTTRRLGFYGLFLEYRQPFLRPVADRIFPTLHARLAERVSELHLL